MIFWEKSQNNYLLNNKAIPKQFSVANANLSLKSVPKQLNANNIFFEK